MGKDTSNLRLLSVVWVVVWMAAWGCAPVAPPGDKTGRSAPPDAPSPAPRLPGLHLVIQFKPQVDPALVKSYCGAFGLGEEAFAPTGVAHRMMEGFSTVLQSWNIPCRSESVPGAACLTGEIKFSESLIMELDPYGVKAPVCESTLCLHAADGAVLWQGKAGASFMGVIIEEKQNFWSFMLRRMGGSLFWNTIDKGLVEALKANGYEFCPTPGLKARMQNSMSSYENAQVNLQLAGRLKDSSFVDEAISFLAQNRFQPGPGCTAAKYLGDIGSPRAVLVLLRELQEFPTDRFDSGQDVYLSWLLDSLEKNRQDPAVLPALRTKMETVKIREYRDRMQSAWKKVAAAQPGRSIVK